MNFLSPVFLCALPLILGLYNFIPQKLRPYLLLLASWSFYIYGSPGSFWVLIAITVISYCYGLILEKRRNFFILTAGILPVLGFLIIYKYMGLGLTLPVGISFYTFQTLSYMIDVYKKDCKAEANFFRYSLFVSFFPQLVAGPIERPQNLIPQLQKCKVQSSEHLKEGLILMLMGFYKKVAVADFLAPLVDKVYSDPSLWIGPVVLFASILFSMQIYADFSGYSDIARGCAGLFGIELSVNFDHPYISASLREFWKKWHITLTKWLTDYIYIPLGGSRKGKFKLIINTLVVFLISGIWHGAGLKFILWGLGHGIIVLFEDIPPVKKAINSLPKWPAVFINFMIVNLLWIFFRAPDTNAALTMIKMLKTGWDNPILKIFNIFVLTKIPKGPGIICILLSIALLYLFPKVVDISKKYRVVLFIMAIIIIFIRMYQIELGTTNSFIYFRF
ncbi:MAG: MBOAT family protein [Butyrivibrio sp.]|uniref:MBOAT family O-acyltransferase n=1 Tax=Butyrivibrio sp. TaxID=28121 RepID=UPI001B0762DF|nr:MBOAT family O-acyltransferase [Butyrivibrio sp.]MBO6239259.1 MBOAT family protein [Butyrivibrio sp.]